MARAFTASMLAEIAKQTVSPILLYEGEFDGGAIHLWSGVGSIVWNGNSYTGAGQLLSVSQVEETVEVRAAGVQIGLSGLPSSFVSLALSNARQGKKGRLWLGFMKADKYLALPGSAGNNATSPDSVASRITGDIDVRAKVAMTLWKPAAFSSIFSKRNGSTAATSCYVFGVNGTTGLLLFFWSDGVTQFIVTSTIAPTVADGAVLWIRATLAVNNGAGGNDVRFWTSPDNVTWTQLGATVTTAGVTSIRAGSDSLEIGSQIAGSASFLGANVYYAEVRNGINGAVAVKFDPSNDWLTTPLSLTSGTGEVWTVNRSGATPAEIRTANPEIIADPYQVFTGLLDVPTMDETGDTSDLSVSYENRLIGLLTANDRRYTPEDQHVDFPGDTGFDNVAGLQDATIVW